MSYAIANQTGMLKCQDIYNEYINIEQSLSFPLHSLNSYLKFKSLLVVFTQILNKTF